MSRLSCHKPVFSSTHVTGPLKGIERIWRNEEMERGNRERVTLNPCNVAYRQWGTRGKPVVLLHGIPTNSSLWERTGPRLSALGYHVYAPEMLGLGYTEGPIDHDHSLEGQARLISRFIEMVVKEECILVGHDLGGGVAQIIAAGLSSRAGIGKYVFTNSVAADSWPIEGIKPLIAASSRKDYREIFSPRFLSGFIRKGLSAGLTDASLITGEFLDDLCGGLGGTRERVEHFVRFLRAVDNRYTREAFPALRTLGQPALVIWAEGDRFQPVTVGERLRDILPDAAWELIGGGHFHPLESDALAEAIARWDNN